MYTPRAFVETDLAALDALIARDPFVTLITGGENGPNISHLPVLYARDGDAVSLRGHWARPNPQWRDADGCTATVIVHGPHAYVSPSWYPDSVQAARVPTWNYAVAHLTGRLRIFENTDTLVELVGDLSRHNEAMNGTHWQFDPHDERYRSQLRGIVGFEFEADQFELKFKLNQNHPPANVEATANALDQQSHPASREIAALMRDHLARRQPPEL